MATVNWTFDGALGRIVLSNPARYNAMSRAMWQGLGDAMVAISGKPEVRAVVIRGDGDKAFAAGADISEFATERSDPARVQSYDRELARALAAVGGCPVPVVACIHGVCMGGGLGLALGCDLRYAARNARFRLPAARLGLGYGWAGVQRMVQVLGAARSAELFYTARTYDGVEAERIGLVHAAYDAPTLDDAVEKILAAIVENAPLTVRAAKLAIREATRDAAERDIGAVEHAVRACFESADYVEGRQAFMEKRRPRFTGR
jgi:enoyl-CoA hydratase/carnithine racemase